MTHTTTQFRLAAAAGAALSLGVLLTGCSLIDTAITSAADAWQLTYEVTTDSPDPVALSNLSYTDMKTRTSGQHTVALSDAETVSGATGAAPLWSAESIVIVGDPVSVTATPPADVRASCRILLDGTQEIAAETGEPGQPVTCAATAPPFPKN